MQAMSPSIEGIHHITAITADAQKCINFYAKILGLRFIKLTVNFDDPSSYHLYFGDAVGSPGTILTFFVWPGGNTGKQGIGQATTVAFSIPEEAMAFWMHRLTHFGIPFEKKKGGRFDDNYLVFKDPDGMVLELVADDTENPSRWTTSDIAVEAAIQGFHSVTLWEDGFAATHAFLTTVLGYTQQNQSESTFRYAMKEQGYGRFIDVRSAPDFWPSTLGTGAIHHIAFRVPDDAAQHKWREYLVQQGANVSPVMDRKYFHSIYFHEPGGVLFELATEGPGFTVDEPREQLGTKLQLPDMYEPLREKIEAVLPKVVVP